MIEHFCKEIFDSKGNSSLISDLFSISIDKISLVATLLYSWTKLDISSKITFWEESSKYSDLINGIQEILETYINQSEEQTIPFIAFDKKDNIIYVYMLAIIYHIHLIYV